MGAPNQTGPGKLSHWRALRCVQRRVWRATPFGPAIFGAIAAVAISWALTGNAPLGAVAWLMLMMAGWLIQDACRSMRPVDPPSLRVDSQSLLDGTVDTWLRDDRPAPETVEEFERAVERALRGLPF